MGGGGSSSLGVNSSLFHSVKHNMFKIMGIEFWKLYTVFLFIATVIIEKFNEDY